MLNLEMEYEQLPLPKGSNQLIFTAVPIKKFINHRIAKNPYDNPTLLIGISNIDEEITIPKQNLYHLQVFYNLKCDIEVDGKIHHDNFSVISYTGEDTMLKKLFLKTVEVLVVSLGNSPTNKKIRFVIESFVELFKSLQEVPKESIQGLWAELLLMEQSKNTKEMIEAWHSSSHDNFDFSFKKLRIEVKSSANNKREHLFSVTQLNPIQDSSIIVVSIFVNTLASGVSIIDLVNRISTKLQGFPKQIEKLHMLVYSTLGAEYTKVSEIKFDYGYAVSSIALYNSLDIPKIIDELIPTDVSGVKFLSNLSNTKIMREELDTLILQ